MPIAESDSRTRMLVSVSAAIWTLQKLPWLQIYELNYSTHLHLYPAAFFPSPRVLKNRFSCSGHLTQPSHHILEIFTTKHELFNCTLVTRTPNRLGGHSGARLNHTAGSEVVFVPCWLRGDLYWEESLSIYSFLKPLIKNNLESIAWEWAYSMSE